MIDHGISVDDRVYYNVASLYTVADFNWFHTSIRSIAPSAILPSDWPTASWGAVVDPQDESRAYWNETPR